MIYYNDTAIFRNGIKIKQTDNYETIRQLATGKEKVNLPVLCVHGGVRGTYCPTNIFFIDIDVKTHTKEVLQKAQDIFVSIPCIQAIQESFSGKLHFMCLFNTTKTIPTAQEWESEARLQSVVVLHLLKSHFNIDFLNKEAFDWHNLQFTQLLFVCDKPIYENKNANGITISANDRNQLKLMYPEFFQQDTDEIELSDIYITPQNIANYTQLTVNKKITIDRNFYIGSFKDKNGNTIELKGNDLRWRIGSALLHMLGSKDKAQEFVKEHFTNHKEFTYYDKKTNRIVYKWLLDNFFEEKQNNVPDDKYLTDFHKEITSYLDKNDRIQIKGTVGIGKSTEIIQLAKQLNAVLIVPYLSTNKLYEGQIEVVSADNNNKYNPMIPQCMVFDQAVKCDLSGRTVIVDESHTLYLERDFRPSAILLLPKLKDCKKVILVSATPCNELQYLGGGKTITYSKKHLPVRITPYFYSQEAEKLYSIESTIEKHLTGHSKWDIICIMDDKIAKMIYDVYHKSFKDDILYFRSETKKNNECVEMFDKQLLTKKLVICTRVAFNGLNFNNINQKILLIAGITCPQLIIQQAGRFRNVSIDMHMYVNSSDTYQPYNPIEYAKEKFEYTQENGAEFIHNKELCNTKGYFDAQQELYDFYSKWDYENTCEYLQNEGYFRFNKPIVLKRSKGVKKENPNLKISNLIKANTLPTFEDLSVSERMSFKENIKSLDRFCSRWNIQPLFQMDLDTDLFLGMFAAYYKDKYWLLKLLNSFDTQRIITSILEEIEDIVYISIMDEEVFDVQIQLLKNWINHISKNPKLTEKVKYENSKLKRILDIRSMNYTGNSIQIMDLILNDMSNKQVVIKKKRVAGCSVGGKKSNKAKPITIVNTKTNKEKTFKSKDDCMKFLKIAPATFFKWLRGEKLRNLPAINDWKLKN